MNTRRSSDLEYSCTGFWFQLKKLIYLFMELLVFRSILVSSQERRTKTYLNILFVQRKRISYPGSVDLTFPFGLSPYFYKHYISIFWRGRMAMTTYCAHILITDSMVPAAMVCGVTRNLWPCHQWSRYTNLAGKKSRHLLVINSWVLVNLTCPKMPIVPASCPAITRLLLRCMLTCSLQ